jgi:hypothetical protein
VCTVQVSVCLPYRKDKCVSRLQAVDTQEKVTMAAEIIRD